MHALCEELKNCYCYCISLHRWFTSDRKWWYSDRDVETRNDEGVWDEMTDLGLMFYFLGMEIQ